MSLKAGILNYVPWAVNATDLSAGTTQYIVSPVDGYIEEAAGVVQVAIVTGGSITFKTGDALATTVAGLTLTFANSDAAGVRKTDTPTTGSATRAVTKGMLIGVVVDGAFNGGGALGGGYIAIRSADIAPALPAV